MRFLSIQDVELLIHSSTKLNFKIDNLDLYSFYTAKIVIFFLLNNNVPAAYVKFENQGTIYQVKAAMVYPEYKGRLLMAKIYKYVYENANVCIQSDFDQSAAGRYLWINSLPKIGLMPFIYNTTTGDREPLTINNYSRVYNAAQSKQTHTYTLLLP